MRHSPPPSWGRRTRAVRPEPEGARPAWSARLPSRAPRGGGSTTRRETHLTSATPLRLGLPPSPPPPQGGRGSLLRNRLVRDSRVPEKGVGRLGARRSPPPSW